MLKLIGYRGRLVDAKGVQLDLFVEPEVQTELFDDQLFPILCKHVGKFDYFVFDRNGIIYEERKDVDVSRSD